MTATYTCFKFTVEQDIEISNAKPGLVHVYDYYEKGKYYLLNFYNFHYLHLIIQHTHRFNREMVGFLYYTVRLNKLVISCRRYKLLLWYVSAKGYLGLSGQKGMKSKWVLRSVRVNRYYSLMIKGCQSKGVLLSVRAKRVHREKEYYGLSG